MTETSSEKRQFLTKCFNKKTLIQKAVILAASLVLVLSLSLSFYFWLHNKTEGTQIGENPFWFIEIKWNDGIGWSALAGNLPAIYAIQSIIFIALVAVFLLITHDRITGPFVSLAMCGGLFNLIQRASETGANKGCVLDYFTFGFWRSFPVFNWPDMFVVIGVFGFIISYIIVTILHYKNEKENETR